VSAATADDGFAQGSRTDDLVRLDVPAETEQLRLVRLVVVSLATTHGADMDDLEDLRIATGELCASMVDETSTDDRLLVEVSAGPVEAGVSVRLWAHRPGSDAPAELDDLSAMVLETTTDACGTGLAPWADGTDRSGSDAWFERTLHGTGASVDREGDV
jgi:anti-sigma regulatory factor (Ser/Thr protein kinase)